MKNNYDLDFYREETEKILDKYNQISTKSNELHDEVSKSMAAKKERFEEKRKAKSKDFKFLRNK